VVTVLWDVMPCALIDRYERFGGAYLFQFFILKMEAAHSSKNLYASTKLCVVTPYNTVILIRR
jgi:hypothetical protein